MYDMMEAFTSVQMKNEPEYLTVRPFIILDRPNPLNGTLVKGPMLNPTYSSFVGRVNIPLQHGMTIGELGSIFANQYINNNNKNNDDKKYLRKKMTNRLLKVTVIKMLNWKRDTPYKETSLPWILPSPNMPTLNTVSVYPGLCLIEGTSLSEGRGTTKPFQMIGAPWLNYTFAQQLRSIYANTRNSGMQLRESYFIPTFSKYKNNVTAGVSIVLKDDEDDDNYNFDPMRLALNIIMTAMQMDASKDFQFLQGGKHFDQLIGSNQTRVLLLRSALSNTSEVTVDSILEMHRKELEVSGFLETRLKYLLYQ